MTMAAPAPPCCCRRTGARRRALTSTDVSVTSQGTDDAKKIVRRKRGILTDTIGLILPVTVTAAGLAGSPPRPRPRISPHAATSAPHHGHFDSPVAAISCT